MSHVDGQNDEPKTAVTLCPFYAPRENNIGMGACIAGEYRVNVSARYADVYCTKTSHVACELYAVAQPAQQPIQPSKLSSDAARSIKPVVPLVRNDGDDTMHPPTASTSITTKPKSFGTSSGVNAAPIHVAPGARSDETETEIVSAGRGRRLISVLVVMVLVASAIVLLRLTTDDGRFRAFGGAASISTPTPTEQSAAVPTAYVTAISQVAVLPDYPTEPIGATASAESEPTLASTPTPNSLVDASATLPTSARPLPTVTTAPVDTPRPTNTPQPTQTPIPTPSPTTVLVAVGTPVRTPTPPPTRTVGRSARATPRPTNPTEAAPTEIPSPTGQIAGIGLSRLDWEAAHGQAEAQVGEFLFYENGSYIAAFENGRMRHLTWTWQRGRPASVRAARARIAPLLPDDADLIRVESSRRGRVIELYETKTLKEVFRSTENDPWRGRDRGLISVAYRLGDTQGRVASVTLELGGVAPET